MSGLPVEAVLIGAGHRGRGTYGAYARRRPDRLRIVAIAEPDPTRREALAREQGVPPERCFDHHRALLAGRALAPAAIVATGDREHVDPALRALARGYHVLLEKPIAPDPVDCVRVVEAARRAGRLLQISHVLRYTAFYTRAQEILSAGLLGEPLTFDLKEHVAHWHFAHSYVRGKFRRGAVAAPLLLAKACHDLDLLVWLAARPAERLVSFGRLCHYRAEQAPPGAPPRCSDACPIQARCVHDAVRLYADPPDRVARSWPWTDVSADPSRTARRAALAAGPYGRCVYRCDNDVVDHQVVGLELEGGATASFTVQGLATREQRTLRISGTRGELRGLLPPGRIELTRHGSFEVETLDLAAAAGAAGHHGGDTGLLDHFTSVIARGALGEVRASGEAALESHLLGFAAEHSRATRQVVELAPFRQQIRAEARARSVDLGGSEPAPR